MPRSNQTKQLLAQSLQELMATTPLEKISVNDIVDHANVGRNTFYYHFEDKYDLVNWYFQSGITRFLVELSAYSSWNALLAALETYFLENKVFYCNALSYNGQNSLQQYMFDYLRSIFEQNVRELNPDASAEDTRKIGQFFAGAKPEQTPPAAGSFEVARVLKVAKPLMRGDDVKALQTALIERNYHCGTNGADGTYGRLTAYAVRCFQASKGLIVNGRADRYTIAALGGTWKE